MIHNVHILLKFLATQVKIAFEDPIAAFLAKSCLADSYAGR